MSWVDDKIFEYVEDYGKSKLRVSRILRSPPLALLIHALLLGSWLLAPLLSPERDLPEAPTITVLLAPSAPKPPEPAPPPLPPAPPGPPLDAREAFAAGNLRRLSPVASNFWMPIDFRGALSDAGLDFGPDGLPPGLGDPHGIPGGISEGVAGGVPGGAAGTNGSAAPAPADPVRIAPNSPQAVPVAKVDPIYPEPALKARVQGVVIVDVVVSAAGEPQNLRVVRSQALLEQAALEAVRQWRWLPFVVEGRAVPFKVLVTVQFQLAAKG